MKYLRYIFYIVFIWFIIDGLTPLYYKLTKGAKEKGYDSKLLEDTKVSVSYLLDRDDTIMFSIPSGSNNIRVLSNINIKKQKVQKEEPFSYGIAYEILDGNENIIYKDVYYHYAKVIKYIEPISKQSIYTRFYIDSNLLPASTRKLYIDISKYKNAKKLRIYLEHIDKDALNISLRTYHKIHNPERKLVDMWKRLSIKTKENSARGNVYDQELLLWSEKKNLLSTTWKPFGPLGIRGKDYELNNIYTRKETDELEEIPFYTGIALSSPKRLVYDLKDDKSYYFKTFLDNNNSANVTITHFTDTNTIDIFKYTQSNLDYKTKVFKKGRLQIEANQDIRVNLFDNEDQIVETSKVYKSSIVLLKDKIATYKINHIKGFETPVRISFRSLNTDTNSTLLVQINNRKLNLNVDAKLSLYDGHTSKDLNQNITLEHTKYLLIQKGEDNIKLTATSDMLVNVSIAVPTIAQVKSIGDINFKDEPQWYTIKPVDDIEEIWTYKVDIPAIKTIDVKFSHKPLEIISSNFNNIILSKKDENSSIKFYQYGTVFNKVITNKTVNGIFKSANGIKRVKPYLIYKRKTVNQKDLSIYINGGLILNKDIYNQFGIIKLPYINTNKKINLLIKTDMKGDIYIGNFIKEYNNQFIIKRAVVNLKNDVVYKVFKKDKESLNLSFRVYSPKENKSLKVKISIDKIDKSNNKSYENITVKEKIYYIYPNDTREELDMLYKDKKLMKNDTLFYTLGDDLKSGNYKIKVELLEGNDAYIYGYEGVNNYLKDFYIFKEEL